MDNQNCGGDIAGVRSSDSCPSERLIRFGPDVRLDDGLLDVFVCLRRAPFVGSLASDVVALARDRFHRADGIRHFQARQIAIEAESPLPIQFDGDSAGQTPTIIEIAPDALLILSPQ